MPICTIEKITESKSQAAKTVENLANAVKKLPCNPSMRQRSVDVFAKSYGNSATFKGKLKIVLCPWSEIYAKPKIEIDILDKASLV